MDLNECKIALKNGANPTREGRTKKLANKPRGKRVIKPTDADYDRHDSDSSRFSQGNVNGERDSSSSRERKRRDDVKKKCAQSQKEQLRQIQREKYRQYKMDTAEDLTAEEDSPIQQQQPNEFESIPRTEHSERIVNEWNKNYEMHDEDTSVECIESKPKSKARRGQHHQNSSLLNLDGGNNGSSRLLNKNRRGNHKPKQHLQRGDPLDQANQEMNQYASASDFRKKSNFTQNMGGAMDVILQKPSSRFPDEQRYGKGSMESRRRRKQKNEKEQIVMNSTMGTIPRKQKSREDKEVIQLHDDVVRENFCLHNDDGTTDMDDVNAFANSPEKSPAHSSGSSSKRKNRGSLVQDVEMVPTSKRPSRGGGADDPHDVDVDMSENRSDEDMVEQDCDDDYIMQSVSTCNTPLADDDYAHLNAKKGRKGRQDMQYDFDTHESHFESETKRKQSFNLGLTKVNGRDGACGKKKGAKKGKNAMQFGESFRGKRDSLDNGKSQAGSQASNREKSDGWNRQRTKDASRMGGMAPLDSPNGGWLNRLSSNDKKKGPKKRRSKTKSSSQSSVDTEYQPSPPRRSSRRSRSKARVEGSTNDNAITIDDSSSDESSIVEAASVTDVEASEVEPLSQDSQTRSTRATGDLLGIDIARIAVGKKVFKSKCALKLQPGTRRPYLLFVFLTELGEHEKIRVPLDGDGLKEFAYYLVNEEKEESEEYDDSMSIVAFCVTPSDSNGLKKFDKWYDGDDETSGMKYITMELRDKDEFQTMLVVMQDNYYLKSFCDEKAAIDFGDIDNYTKALVEDDKAEKAKRHSAPRTRSKGKGKVLSGSDNKLLVVYPFKVEEEELQSVSAGLKELGGDLLGVTEDADDVIRADASDGDSAEDEADETNRNESGNSARTTHYLSIREDDKERLEPGQFLNDTLVDFWMSWISRNHSSNADPNSVHFFTSHFLTTLSEEGPEGVKSWTINEKRNRKIPVFEKKFIFVPVNGDLHWSLCVVVNPGLILKAHEYDETDEEAAKEWPCILFLDSLKMHRKKQVAKRIMTWLNYEWNRSMQETDGFVKSPFTPQEMRLVTPKVPYQDNGCDCGVFVCRYAYNLYVMRNQVFSLLGIKDHFEELITDGPAFDFDMDDIARIRKEMKKLIDGLCPLYDKHKKEEKALKAAAKREKNEPSKAANQEDVAVERGPEKENSPLTVQNASQLDESVAL